MIVFEVREREFRPSPEFWEGIKRDMQKESCVVATRCECGKLWPIGGFVKAE